MLELSLHAKRGNFTLCVECGLSSRWTVLFGPSGAGKSTLLRLIAGLGDPVNSRIVLDGQVLLDTARRVSVRVGRREVSLVAQQAALFPHLSVAQNVAFGLAGMDRAECKLRVEKMLELVDAVRLSGRKAQNLSGGEAQRVALARALAVMPKLLLLDEPFSALDSAASDALLERLQCWLQEHKIQTILATHDVTDALATAASVAQMREGRLVDVGPANEVLRDERERLVQRLGRIDANNRL